MERQQRPLDHRMDARRNSVDAFRPVIPDTCPPVMWVWCESARSRHVHRHCRRERERAEEHDGEHDSLDGRPSTSADRGLQVTTTRFVALDRAACCEGCATLLTLLCEAHELGIGRWLQRTIRVGHRLRDIRRIEAPSRRGFVSGIPRGPRGLVGRRLRRWLRNRRNGPRSIRRVGFRGGARANQPARAALRLRRSSGSDGLPSCRRRHQEQLHVLRRHGLR